MEFPGNHIDMEQENGLDQYQDRHELHFFFTSASDGRGSFLANITTWKTKSVIHFRLKPKRLSYCLTAITALITPGSL